MNITVLGLSILSSWGNGHATTYRGLVRALQRRGHRVTFLERDLPWYAANRDAGDDFTGVAWVYQDLDELRQRFTGSVREADLVIVGSFVPDGVAVADWALRTAAGATAFYDIDTPITLRKLAAGDEEYLTRALVPRFDLYLSFTGGPTLERLCREFGAQRAELLACSVDPERYQPPAEPVEPSWDLGYMGTYSDDRQPGLEALMLEPLRRRPDLRGCVAGPKYPDDLVWPDNAERIMHLHPPEHPGWYARQRYTLNITREAMKQAGWAPSVRLFEAAACGTPVISDTWPGLEGFLVPGKEILLSQGPEQTLSYLLDYSEADRQALAERARAKVLSEHTPDHRAAALEAYVGHLARPVTVAGDCL